MPVIVRSREIQGYASLPVRHHQLWNVHYILCKSDITFHAVFTLLCQSWFGGSFVCAISRFKLLVCGLYVFACAVNITHWCVWYVCVVVCVVCVCCSFIFLFIVLFMFLFSFDLCRHTPSPPPPSAVILVRVQAITIPYRI